MPAVNPARLQQQAAQLSELFSTPSEYIDALKKLLESYSVQVHRQGRTKGIRPVLFSFETPAPVLKQLHLEMALQARQQPFQALAIVDALWAARSIESRTLAARLLGAIPVTDTTEVTGRLESWVQENREQVLAAELSEHSTLILCEGYPKELVSFVHKLLASGELRKQVLGLGALQTLLRKNHFNNLPALFRLLADLSADPTKGLRPYLAEVLSLLAERSPNEMLFFLQQSLAEKPTEGAKWIARQVLKALPDAGQEKLRTALKT